MVVLQPYSYAAQEREQSDPYGYRGGKWQTMAIGQKSHHGYS